MSVRRRWLRRLGLAAVAAVALDLVLSRAADGADEVTVAALVLAGVACLGLVLDAAAVLGDATWAPPARQVHGADREDQRLAAYRHLLVSNERARQPDTVLQDRLLRIAETRVAQVYGLTWATDPQRMQALLGPVLSTYRIPVPRCVPTTEIDQVLTRIEQL